MGAGGGWGDGMRWSGGSRENGSVGVPREYDRPQSPAWGSPYLLRARRPGGPPAASPPPPPR